MDAKVLVGANGRGVGNAPEAGRASQCRAGVSQVCYVHFPRTREGTLQSMVTAEDSGVKGGMRNVHSIWDRATAYYVRVMNALDEPRGQGLVEYALIIGVVAVMLAGALYGYRTALITSFGNSSAQMANISGS
ncbi:MAG: Flp family type IVb pilin [Chloroflexota bacterium]